MFKKVFTVYEIVTMSIDDKNENTMFRSIEALQEWSTHDTEELAVRAIEDHLEDLKEKGKAILAPRLTILPEWKVKLS